MTLRPQPLPPVPEATVGAVARPRSPKGTSMWLCARVRHPL